MDANYKVPDGFEPVLTYPDGENGIPMIGRAQLKTEKNILGFFIDDPPEQIPVLPLKGDGNLWHTGWDIPTLWAIDGSGRCWANDANGSFLTPIDVEKLFSLCENDVDKILIAKILGIPEPEPKWMEMARAAEWNPPENNTNK